MTPGRLARRAELIASKVLVVDSVTTNIAHLEFIREVQQHCGDCLGGTRLDRASRSLDASSSRLPTPTPARAWSVV